MTELSERISDADVALDLSELTELARALHITMPSLRDAKQTAIVVRNIMRNRGVELVRVAS